MKVFISWSGEKSKAVAKVLRRRLPNILQAVEPYMSDQDIDKGDRWFDDISSELQNTSFCIVCLTPSNLTSAWISFEAGAIAAKLEESQVTALLIDLNPSDVTGPLPQFQHTEINREDFRKLVISINKRLGEQRLPDQRLDDQIDAFWPRIEKEMESAVENVDSYNNETEIKRTDRDLLEEILDLTRKNVRKLDQIGKKREGIEGSLPGDVNDDQSKARHKSISRDEALKAVLSLPQNIREIAERSTSGELSEIAKIAINIRESENPEIDMAVQELFGADTDDIAYAAISLVRVALDEEA